MANLLHHLHLLVYKLAGKPKHCKYCGKRLRGYAVDTKYNPATGDEHSREIYLLCAGGSDLVYWDAVHIKYYFGRWTVDVPLEKIIPGWRQK